MKHNMTTHIHFNKFELSIESKDRYTNEKIVRIKIDGLDLIQITREAELPFAKRDNQEDLAGSYDGIFLAWFPYAEKEFSGTTWPWYPVEADKGVAAILSCECGEIGCWPLYVNIQMDENRVSWSNFKQPYRKDWDLKSIGNYLFRRDEYDLEILKILETKERLSL